MKIKKIIQYYKIKYLRNKILFHKYKILQKKYDDLLEKNIFEKSKEYDQPIKTSFLFYKQHIERLESENQSQRDKLQQKEDLLKESERKLEEQKEIYNKKIIELQFQVIKMQEKQIKNV